MKKTFTEKCLKNDEGNLALVQKPNLPIMVGLGAYLLSMFAEGRLYSFIDIIGFGALFTWSWLEIFSGVNYFRKLLGLIVTLALVYSRVY